MDTLFYKVFKNIYINHLIIKHLLIYNKYNNKIKININNDTDIINFLANPYKSYMKSIEINDNDDIKKLLYIQDLDLISHPVNNNSTDNNNNNNNEDNLSDNDNDYDNDYNNYKDPEINEIIKIINIHNIESIEINSHEYFKYCTEINLEFIKTLVLNRNKNTIHVSKSFNFSNIPSPIVNSNVLTSLELNDYNGQLTQLPKQLKILKMNTFNQTIKNDILPTSLTHLHLSQFNKPLSYNNEIILPNQLKILILDNFNNVIKSSKEFPESLEIIKLKSYTKEIKCFNNNNKNNSNNNNLNNLKYLKLLNNKNNNKNIKSFPNIKKYKLKSFVDDSVICELPATIKTFSIFSKSITLDLGQYNGNIANIKCTMSQLESIPKTIKKLYINGGFDGFKNGSDQQFNNLKSLYIDFFNEASDTSNNQNENPPQTFKYPKSIKRLKVSLMDEYNKSNFDYSTILPTNQLKSFKLEDSFDFSLEKGSNFLSNFGASLQHLDLGHQCIINFNQLNLSTTLTSLKYLATSIENINSSTLFPPSLQYLNIIVFSFGKNKTITYIPDTVKCLIALGPDILFNLPSRSIENLDSIYISNTNKLLTTPNSVDSLLFSKTKVLNLVSNLNVKFKHIYKICKIK
ncbi:hypothetical protein DICPUDRAFT_80515 [Dictyostelium purpureum]|uniref:FNIP repeat-containing protein n=1 Tax=Dictyostelium purpureum TaxID=5786 RepID=F0ZQQ0_DICPU|nr:uncharacterized protein DICPUDRAFT_80515 [Dictyostelium purpureum]EGC33741.1 hypothetical protein DICPUDRAFT_80515 [Dictyostelium purpureum]|eukprot:XP_003289740.1 hypothetical protein DICPUDRAFT_80515 [Dictyostelium purpureum]